VDCSNCVKGLSHHGQLYPRHRTLSNVIPFGRDGDHLVSPPQPHPSWLRGDHVVRRLDSDTMTGTMTGTVIGRRNNSL
jgi:hypothetical protein